MPAVLMVKAQTSPVPDSPGRWQRGEIVNTREDQSTFGFLEMPVNNLGTATVAEINALDPLSIPLYGSYKALDSGEITTGNTTGVGVLADDIVVWQANDTFISYGPRTEVPQNFYHIRISDKTVEEVNVYLEAYNKKLSYTSDQYDPGTDNRRFTTTNDRVSASGNNGFTEQGILDAIAEWNTNHPANTVTLVDTDNLTYFQCDGIMPASLFQEWQDNTQEVALQDYYARRRWYITEAGMNALENNLGIINGTAADVNPFLRDGLLD